MVERQLGATQHLIEHEAGAHAGYAFDAGQLAEQKLESIEFPKSAARDLNYRLAIQEEAYSTETARRIEQEITNPTFGEFRANNALAVSERFTTVFRELEQTRPEAYRRAIMALDQQLNAIVRN